MNHVYCVIKRDVYPQKMHSCSKNIRAISVFVLKISVVYKKIYILGDIYGGTEVTCAFFLLLLFISFPRDNDSFSGFFFFFTKKDCNKQNSFSRGLFFFIKRKCKKQNSFLEGFKKKCKKQKLTHFHEIISQSDFSFMSFE